jgi:multiple sugar transport system permease protein
MIFSPITARSFPVKFLHFVLYLLLTAGGVTMVVPFLVMISGSLEPAARANDSTFFPKYLVLQDALRARYLEAKYAGSNDLYRMASGDPKAALSNPARPEADPVAVARWNDFLSGHPTTLRDFGVGFLRGTTRMPAYNGRAFRQWIMAGAGQDLTRLNTSLGTPFSKPTQIVPPTINIIGAPLIASPLVVAFEEFCRTEVPLSQRFAWDAGSYYRTVFLPRIFANDLAAFNTQYGTTYASFSRIPFSATPPDVARDQWFTYVSRVLRTDFVNLTPDAEQRRQGAGVSKDTFITTLAKAEDLVVVSVDRIFAEWVFTREGILDARIPQAQVDLAAFEKEGGHWKRVFLTLNYLTVFDEVFLYGRAVLNTFILVILAVCGALIVNPLAAYALSRFRLPQTYSILLFLIATISFPAEVTMIPVFLQLKELNLLNTFGALVLPSLANGFSIFLLKGFFDSLPKELYEAAQLDGAGEFRMFWLIAMRLSTPILAVIALGSFVSAYSAFFYALILAPDPRMWTIMVYIYQLQQSVDAPVVYASLIITAIPTLLVFIFCQDIILKGIVVPSDK